METKVVFVGGGELRAHEDLKSVLTKITSAGGDWVELDRGGTRPHPVCVNSANVAYLEEVAELEPAVTAG
jgi:hypothetical protein